MQGFMHNTPVRLKSTSEGDDALGSREVERAVWSVLRALVPFADVAVSFVRLCNGGRRKEVLLDLPAGRSMASMLRRIYPEIFRLQGQAMPDWLQASRAFLAAATTQSDAARNGSLLVGIGPLVHVASASEASASEASAVFDCSGVLLSFGFESEDQQHLFVNNRPVECQPLRTFLNDYFRLSMVAKRSAGGDKGAAGCHDGVSSRLPGRGRRGSGGAARQLFPGFLLLLTCPLSEYQIGFNGPGAPAAVAFKNLNAVKELLQGFLSRCWGCRAGDSLVQQQQQQGRRPTRKAAMAAAAEAEAAAAGEERPVAEWKLLGPPETRGPRSRRAGLASLLQREPPREDRRHSTVVQLPQPSLAPAYQQPAASWPRGRETLLAHDDLRGSSDGRLVQRQHPNSRSQAIGGFVQTAITEAVGCVQPQQHLSEAGLPTWSFGGWGKARDPPRDVDSPDMEVLQFGPDLELIRIRQPPISEGEPRKEDWADDPEAFQLLQRDEDCNGSCRYRRTLGPTQPLYCECDLDEMPEFIVTSPFFVPSSASRRLQEQSPCPYVDFPCEDSVGTAAPLVVAREERDPQEQLDGSKGADGRLRMLEATEGEKQCTPAARKRGRSGAAGGIPLAAEIQPEAAPASAPAILQRHRSRVATVVRGGVSKIHTSAVDSPFAMTSPSREQHPQDGGMAEAAAVSKEGGGVAAPTNVQDQPRPRRLELCTPAGSNRDGIPARQVKAPATGLAGASPCELQQAEAVAFKKVRFSLPPVAEEDASMLPDQDDGPETEGVQPPPDARGLPSAAAGLVGSASADAMQDGPLDDLARGIPAGESDDEGDAMQYNLADAGFGRYLASAFEEADLDRSEKQQGPSLLLPASGHCSLGGDMIQGGSTDVPQRVGDDEAICGLEDLTEEELDSLLSSRPPSAARQFTFLEACQQSNRRPDISSHPSLPPSLEPTAPVAEKNDEKPSSRPPYLKLRHLLCRSVASASSGLPLDHSRLAVAAAREPTATITSFKAVPGGEPNRYGQAVASGASSAGINLTQRLLSGEAWPLGGGAAAAASRLTRQRLHVLTLAEMPPRPQMPPRPMHSDQVAVAKGAPAGESAVGRSLVPAVVSKSMLDTARVLGQVTGL